MKTLNERKLELDEAVVLVGESLNLDATGMTTLRKLVDVAVNYGAMVGLEEGREIMRKSFERESV